MMCNYSNFWDTEAKRKLTTKTPKWLIYYTGNSFRKATEMGLKYIGISGNKVNLLKTDLWNEGIDTGRDILSQYQDDEKFNLYGMDISHSVSSSAQKRAESIHVIQGDIRNIASKDSSFDIILDLSTLDHIPLHQVSDAIQEYKRVLKKEGILVLVYCYDSALLRLIFKLRRIEDYREQPVRGNVYYFPRSLLKGLVKRDFNILEEFCTSSLLHICNRITAPIIERLPKPIYDLVLDIEYSKISKYLLKSFAGFHAIIARRK